jgi:hypothetical protein
MKFSILILLGVIPLAGCSSDISATTKSYLQAACEGVERYGNSLDPSIRLIEMDKASSNFRKAALESSEVKFEVLAEYSRRDTPNFKEIEAFCKEL